MDAEGMETAAAEVPAEAVLEDAVGDQETYALTIQDYGKLMVSSIPIGSLAAGMIMIAGLAVAGIVKIFKKL